MLQPFCLFGVTSWLLVSCSTPSPPPKAIPVQETVPAEAPITSAPVEAVEDKVPFHPLRAKTINSQGIELTIVSFDRRNHQLVVADQVGGPASRYDDAEEAGRGHLAAINGGFFTPSGSPLGLVIANGTRKGAVNRASFLGTGFFLGPEARLISRADYLASLPSNTELLQSGPRLVWSSETLTGLSDKDRRPRSFLLWDGKEHFALGFADSASLRGLSSLLQSQPVSGFEVAYALNLDGGRSCDFWVSSSVDGGGFTRSSFLKKDVRNYLVLKRKP